MIRIFFISISIKITIVAVYCPVITSVRIIPLINTIRTDGFEGLLHVLMLLVQTPYAKKANKHDKNKLRTTIAKSFFILITRSVRLYLLKLHPKKLHFSLFDFLTAAHSIAFVKNFAFL